MVKSICSVLWVRRSMRIQLLGKPGCHLCEEAKGVVQSVCAELRLALELIDIEEHPELYERFKEEIPVLLLDGRKIFKYHIEPEALRNALSRRGF
jgi:glutaredoxin